MTAATPSVVDTRQRPESGAHPRRFSRLVLACFILTVASPAAGQALDRAESRVPTPHRLAGNTGAVAGTLRFAGSPPRPGVLRVHKERTFCGSAVPDQSLVIGPEGGLKNVVVTLSGTGLEGHARPPGAIQLDNIGCRFAPHVQAAQVGSTLLLLNSDPILHDAHARLGPRTVFNDGLPWWRRVKRTLDRPGLLKIICELHHAWMSAYIVVWPNPFFAVTDSTGRYRIDGIPPGTYEARFWHERLGVASRRVVVEAGVQRRVDLLLPP
ncbi:MAG: carboxypeptidase regulatory-like domain-containing protein [Deltaproteobacteria bacterium]|nr:carboxypeptidase regulatory-like domain-containing protein [Deltaproteobacteria bacterium]